MIKNAKIIEGEEGRELEEGKSQRGEEKKRERKTYQIVKKSGARTMRGSEREGEKDLPNSQKCENYQVEGGKEEERKTYQIVKNAELEGEGQRGKEKKRKSKRKTYQVVRNAKIIEWKENEKEGRKKRQ
ncbi:hypothetical protein F4604DRAFT_1673387 [Suillus subluteus]|nr:hypothetical protein F4604DRAFT_1683485 [Suillus subluteus]KAG1889848.1 hypothetical protein F4604DRAFT_1673387 [Suillus subluteus]